MYYIISQTEVTEHRKISQNEPRKPLFENKMLVKYSLIPKKKASDNKRVG